MKTFTDFSTDLLRLKTQLEGKQQEDIANVAGDGAVSMPPTARKVVKKKKTFSVSPQVFDMFRRGKKKFEKWSKYLNLEDESQRALYSWAIKNHHGVIILQNAVTGEVRAIRHNRMGGGQWHKLSRGIVGEDKDMPKAVLDDAEEIVKDLKKKKADFAKRYGKDAKKVMYATAMKMAKAKNGIESKQFGKMIQQIKSSIENLGQQNEDFNSKIENQLYETPAIANENNINILKDIVLKNERQKINFDKYGSMRVFPEEASILLKVYNELRDDLKEKFTKMLNFNQMGLKSLKNMCYEIATYGEPQGLARPIADIGNMKSPRSRPAYALNANKKKKKETAVGPGMNTYKPQMNLIAKKKRD